MRTYLERAGKALRAIEDMGVNADTLTAEFEQLLVAGAAYYLYLKTENLFALWSFVLISATYVLGLVRSALLSTDSKSNAVYFGFVAFRAVVGVTAAIAAWTVVRDFAASQ